jgi:hypothetical protein
MEPISIILHLCAVNERKEKDKCILASRAKHEQTFGIKFANIVQVKFWNFARKI